MSTKHGHALIDAVVAEVDAAAVDDTKS